MAKVLITDIDGKEYKFALDRTEIIRAEKLGFKIREIENEPLTQISLFWFIGLHKFQPEIKQEEAFELLDKFMEEGGNLPEIVEFLSNEYAAFLQTTPTNSKKLKKSRVEVL